VALLKDGRFIAGAAEERFNRIKNSPGVFTSRAIKWVLDDAGITFSDLDAIAWANDPVGGLERWRSRGNRRVTREAIMRMTEALRSPVLLRGKGATLLSDWLRPQDAVDYQRAQFAYHFGAEAFDIRFECVDHHLSHAASAYYPSGFDEATVITWDGSGDGLSGSVRHGVGVAMNVLQEYWDFSIGQLYWLVHSYMKLSDEGSLMGLAAYGQPNEVLAPYVDAGRLWMDLGRLAGWTDPNSRHVGYSITEMAKLAPRRGPDDGLEESHKDLAAELQLRVEEFCFEIVRRAVGTSGCRRIALAGGVGLNAIFNGKLRRDPDLCEDLFVQPNPGDEGGSLGAACVVSQALGCQAAEPMSHAYYGSSSSGPEIEAVLRNVGVPFSFLADDALFERVAGCIAAGQVVAWVQGPMEWGPRALGNRSILADPRNSGSATRVNEAVKYRDAWRPFAPSMLEEVASTYLEDAHYSPYMIETYRVRPDKRSEIQAVVHADGTTRPQTVRRAVNPRYYDLIAAFGRLTGTPVVLNTSFNLKGEPIVRTPVDALRTFFGSGIDLLVMGNYMVQKGIVQQTGVAATPVL
jgi:carbamoyltransferase